MPTEIERLKKAIATLVALCGVLLVIAGLAVADVVWHGSLERRMIVLLEDGRCVLVPGWEDASASEWLK